LAHLFLRDTKPIAHAKTKEPNPCAQYLNNRMDSAQLYAFSNLLDDLAIHFSKITKKEITRTEIFDALFLLISDSQNFEWSGDLWDLTLSLPDTIQLLKDFDFNTLNKTIEVDENIFPRIVLYQKKILIKEKGLIWVIHNYDKDPFPSNPHAHCIDQNLKLDLSNGNYYRNRKLKGRLRKKDFLSLRTKVETAFPGELPPLSLDKTRSAGNK
jgi:hypothetical protein